LFETFLQKPHSISCRTVFETTWISAKFLNSL
jgi:hypothetical protein